MVFVVAAFACPKITVVVDKLDRSDPLDHLEADLVFTSKPHRRTVQDADWSADFVGKDRQLVTAMRSQGPSMVSFSEPSSRSLRAASVRLIIRAAA